EFLYTTKAIREMYVDECNITDLCIIHDERTILDPRKVMLALSFYVSSFKLTRQQDAAEAFLHLLCSLEEEVSQCYAPHGSSLAEITGLTSRIHKPKSKSHRDYEQWRRYIYGPFDGTVGSILTCRSCSSVLSVDIEHFRSLSLSPALDGNADIMEGCSIIECLERFTALEHLENFRCGRCWHIGALKYLSIRVDKDEQLHPQFYHTSTLAILDPDSTGMAVTSFPCITLGRRAEGAQVIDISLVYLNDALP
ncbi:ubiquitin carboxyl-terminal hydrolase, partial [Musa troglodytarum]